jgi:hypothetical protein
MAVVKANYVRKGISERVTALEIAEVGATAPCGAVLPRLRVALREPRGPVAVQPAVVRERPVQTASEHCLPQCGIKPIVSDSRKY